jgi:hypothetical protein
LTWGLSKTAATFGFATPGDPDGTRRNRDYRPEHSRVQTASPLRGVKREPSASASRSCVGPSCARSRASRSPSWSTSTLAPDRCECVADLLPFEIFDRDGRCDRYPPWSSSSPACERERAPERDRYQRWSSSSPAQKGSARMTWCVQHLQLRLRPIFVALQQAPARHAERLAKAGRRFRRSDAMMAS